MRPLQGLVSGAAVGGTFDAAHDNVDAAKRLALQRTSARVDNGGETLIAKISAAVRRHGIFVETGTHGVYAMVERRWKAVVGRAT